MGQALYSPPSVKGWPSGMGWMSNDALMRRGNAIGALVGVYAYEQVPEVQDDMLHHWEMRELASASDGRYWVPSDRLIRPTASHHRWCQRANFLWIRSRFRPFPWYPWPG